MFQQPQRKMFKILSPIEKPNGTKWWMFCGNAYENKDNSVNMYINALPVGQKPGPLTLQLRELTEAELRERDQKRASYASRGTVDASGLGSSSGAPYPVMPPSSSVAVEQDAPF